MKSPRRVESREYGGILSKWIRKIRESRIGGTFRRGGDTQTQVRRKKKGPGDAGRVEIFVPIWCEGG